MFSDKINRDIIVLMIHGSYLYGTNTVMSDRDYAGVYMPSLDNDLILNRMDPSLPFTTKEIEHEKNKPNDVDFKVFSFNRFIDLACEGQTIALDMLHAPDDMILEKSNVWDDIIERREKFYTKNLEAFIGYARQQASKYGIKGSRLNTAQKFIDLLDKYPDDARLSEIWQEIDKIFRIDTFNDNVEFHDTVPIRQIEICNRCYQETYKVGYVKNLVQKYYDKYGERAKEAAINKNIDWKAVSHALRASYQVKEIFTEGTITFPLKEAEYLKTVKAGKLDYLTEVAPKLEGMISEIEELSLRSNLPESVDRKYWDNFVISRVKSHYGIRS